MSNSNRNSRRGRNMIDIEIDKLTNCLVNNSTDKEVNTYVETLKKPIKNTKYWTFNWNKVIKESFNVKTLKVVNSDEIQGLIATKMDSSGGYM